MANELRPFVKQALEKGSSRSDIHAILLKAGWQEDEVKDALSYYLDTPFPVPVPRRKPYLSAREAFLYLILFLTLYIGAVSVGTLLFQFINLWIPNPAQIYGGYEWQASIDIIRRATASLIITFPIFLFISWLLHKTFLKDPDKRGSKIRKWLTYITLFIATAVIIIDLVSLVTSLLAGELTLRFILKVLSVLLISCLVFGYYLWDLRKEEKE